MIDTFVSSDFGFGLTKSGNDIIKVGFTDENICGEGASCVVYQMRLGGLRVAVKRLKPAYRTNPTYVAAYSKEFSIGQRLKHDALPIYRELRSELDDVYIVMDFIDGISLNDFIKTEDGRQYFHQADNARRFLKELLGVVIYLHRSGVIHCDIKPANVMLRHSDRGAMLFDFDKCYCDTFDLTHGGTTLFSDALPEGEKPTVRKDFAAIGYIVDFIADNVSGFPSSEFRKFRQECDVESPDAYKLQTALNATTKTYYRFIGVAIVAAVIAIPLFLMVERKTAYEEIPTAPSLIPVRDTIVVQPTASPSVSTQPTSKIIIDFDGEMDAFIQEGNSAMSELKSGRLSNDEIREQIYHLTEIYTETYGNMVSEYKRTYPMESAIDIEMAVARASENSAAVLLFQQFTAAATDTINLRNPEIYQ